MLLVEFFYRFASLFGGALVVFMAYAGFFRSVVQTLTSQQEILKVRLQKCDSFFTSCMLF
jgi:uncharacterized membrane protein YdjX (TVP38/TMEM64 family)